jgi:hypothetical protein
VLERVQLIHVIVVIAFHKHIHVHLEHCLDHLVFRQYLLIGNVLQDTVYQVHRVCAQLILQDTRVQVAEPFLDHHV